MHGSASPSSLRGNRFGPHWLYHIGLRRRRVGKNYPGGSHVPVTPPPLARTLQRSGAPVPNPADQAAYILVRKA